MHNKIEAYILNSAVQNQLPMVGYGTGTYEIVGLWGQYFLTTNAIAVD